MADSDVLYEVSERIATITINRPEARNALTSEMLARIPQLMLDAEANDDVDVIIGAAGSWKGGAQSRHRVSLGRCNSRL